MSSAEIARSPTGKRRLFVENVEKSNCRNTRGTGFSSAARCRFGGEPVAALADTPQVSPAEQREVMEAIYKNAAKDVGLSID